MKNILELLENTADRLPDKIAFADLNEDITYKQLLDNAKHVGAYMAAALKLQTGVYTRNKAIAVILDKTVHAVTAFMSVLESGNFYVVIDSLMPADRIKLIFDTLQPVAVLTDDKNKEKISDIGFEGQVFNLMEILDLDPCELDMDCINNIRVMMIDTDPAYALFTSGSTGVPKGAVLSHRNVLAYIDWYVDAFCIDDHTIFGNQTPFYFSMSVSDMYSTIKAGGTFNIIPKEYFAFPIKLMEFLRDRHVNTIYWVPSALSIVANYKMFDYVSLPELKKVLFAGEVMPVKQLNYWIKALPDAMFANLFGPTETTDICTYYVVDREFADDETLPMGRACNNCDVFVLSDQGIEIRPEDVPISDNPGKSFSPEGELYARGSFLSAGYYANDEKTAKAFVQNPLNPYYPEMVYKTGDLVKYNGFGELVYVTRKDFQIKHMGYRIELGEIETAAGLIEGVKTCACVYNEKEDKIILVYEGKRLSDNEMFEGIRSRIPEYMVPNKVVRVKSMPHNQNGKIDRALLKKTY